MRIGKLLKKGQKSIDQGEQMSFLPDDAAMQPRQIVVTAKEAAMNSDTTASLMDSYIAFDVETTGLNPSVERIVELGAVCFVKGKPCGEFSTLVNARHRMSVPSIEITHITNDMVAAAPAEEEVYPALLAFLGDAVEGKTLLCGHNARFDMDFLRTTLERLGFDASLRYVDTLKLSRKYAGKLDNYKQPTVAERYGVDIHNAHRAADDARVCGEILWHIMQEEMFLEKISEEKA